MQGADPAFCKKRGGGAPTWDRIASADGAKPEREVWGSSPRIFLKKVRCLDAFSWHLWIKYKLFVYLKKNLYLFFTNTHMQPVYANSHQNSEPECLW